MAVVVSLPMAVNFDSFATAEVVVQATAADQAIVRDYAELPFVKVRFAAQGADVVIAPGGLADPVWAKSSPLRALVDADLRRADEAFRVDRALGGPGPIVLHPDHPESAMPQLPSSALTHDLPPLDPGTLVGLCLGVALSGGASRGFRASDRLRAAFEGYLRLLCPAWLLLAATLLGAFMVDLAVTVPSYGLAFAFANGTGWGPLTELAAYVPAIVVCIPVTTLGAACTAVWVERRIDLPQAVRWLMPVVGMWIVLLARAEGLQWVPLLGSGATTLALAEGSVGPLVAQVVYACIATAFAIQAVGRDG
jgi:hypothetical protein